MTADELKRRFDNAEWDAIASAIDTGADNLDTSRALIVFNPTDTPISGAATFHVDMPWHDGRTLPSIRVSHQLTAKVVECEVTPPQIEPGRIIFDMLFEVEDVPTQGWDTYIAEYVSTEVELRIDSLSQELRVACSVVESKRHLGTLPPRFSLP